METDAKRFRLVCKKDRVAMRPADGSPDVPVRVAWARPVHGRGGEVCLLDEHKREIAMLPGLHCLDPESRRIAQDELAKRYLIPRIIRIIRTDAYFGNRYWFVVTELGVRRFAMKDPFRSVTWVSQDHMVIRDTLGNRYEINPFSGLDPFSQSEVMKII